jgi:hypothetical protein
MPDLHLAQINIARMLAPLDSPVMADFVNALAQINALADRSPGFVWRLQSEEGNATSIRPYDDDMIIVNMSVWESIEALRGFVYKSAHAAYVRRRAEWFEMFAGPYLTLWWIPAGHIPSVLEAKERLDHLRTHGETPFAFSFKRTFLPDGIQQR